MNVLAIDVGGTHVKILVTGEHERREFPSGPKLTAEAMVAGVKALAKGWKCDAVAIGYPGPVLHDHPVAEPHNLAPGWVGFDFDAAFGCPVKIINDAAMQALGSYRKGRMLFLGLGTGLGTACVVDGDRRAHGARPSALQEGDLRGLRWAARTGETREEEVAASMSPMWSSA